MSDSNEHTRWRLIWALILGGALGALLACPSQAMAQTPPLPEGLDDGPALPAGLDDGPALPAGLDDGPALPAGLDDGPDEASDDSPGADEPALPEGLGEVEAPAPEPEDSAFSSLRFRGFIDGRGGLRLAEDPHEDTASLGEARLQIDVAYEGDQISGRVVSDFIYDPVLDEHDTLDLETGEGPVDLREANLAASPLDFLDLKIGRQILTWGTGDLVFINDLFPKDWNALLIGRDMAYLKAPSDAAKASIYTEWVNLDLIYTPRFDADRFPDRRRVSSWDPMLNRLAGQDAVVTVDTRSAWFDEAEYAARLYGRIGALEWAAYGYRGYWKSPAGMNPATGEATFPALGVYGASFRGPLAGGIASVEGGWYDAVDDRDGRDPFSRNGEIRALVGYERELVSELTLGVQYYLEHMQHHDRHLAGLPPGAPRPEADRHVVTARLTMLSLSQRLTSSIFAFYSPSDEDGYVRPRVRYAFDDHLTAEIGGNLLFGQDPYTFFGQLRRNTNVYSAVRWAW